jgi:hypothetical protein
MLTVSRYLLGAEMQILDWITSRRAGAGLDSLLGEIELRVEVEIAKMAAR